MFHAGAIALAPELDRIHFLGLRERLTPYLKALGFDHRWSFFAPEPGPPKAWFEADLLDASGHAFGFDRFPTRDSRWILEERWSRRLAATEFMLQEPIRLERILAPYFCHTSGAASIQLTRVWQPVLSFEAAVRGDEPVVKREFMFHHFCEASP